MFIGEALDKAINDFGKKVVRDARGNLTREKAIASRSLWNSIKYRFDPKKGELRFTMSYYGDFMDKGVTGTGQLKYMSGPRDGVRTVHNIPVPYNKSDGTYQFKSRYMMIGGSLKEWLNAKGMNKNLDFVIRRSVHAKGIRPRRFFTKAFNKNQKSFNAIISKAIDIDIDEELTNILINLEN